ncbi:hypothetical protein B835_2648 [Enterococcus mundtii 3F]|nr:hypothetical protein [Enterococcus mundtii 3F]
MVMDTNVQMKCFVYLEQSFFVFGKKLSQQRKIPCYILE